MVTCAAMHRRSVAGACLLLLALWCGTAGANEDYSPGIFQA